ncbi:MAG: DUF885 domain-containing protein [Acidobacteria bacterium]|nr:DUF885 domain-containing protein [Acidobacteriota bacterium]
MHRFRGFVLLVAVLAAVAPGTAAAEAPDSEAAFLELVEREWRWRLEEFPLLATSTGEHAYDDRLTDESLAAYERRARDTEGLLAALAAIDREGLALARRVDFDIFRAQLEDRLTSHRFGEHLLPLNADSGFHTSFALLARQVPLSTVADYENYLARLRALPRALDQNVALLAEGLRRGITVPRATLAGIDETLRPLAEGAPEAHPLYEPFARVPPTFDAETGERLKREGREAVAPILAAYARVREFVTGLYVPGARASLAATELPDGEAYYRYLVRHFTTLDRSAEEIHRLGLDEVARIRGEMGRVIARTGFSGSFEEFLEFLRTDPRFYPKTAEELLQKAAWIAKTMDGKLPSLFGRLPRQPYGVQPVPEALAPKYTAGRYSSSPRESTEPGWYWVNTYALDTRSLYNLPALTLHEAVPGHHLQGALAEEQEDVLPFRRYSYISAFGEGWGLYSEWLGVESGMYGDPYDEFGFLTYQAWRACRLVVDTGIHAFGWSRERAIEYLAGNTALSRHEVTTEIDRYISWPGQALSYYTGYLELRALRARAETALGEAFDVRAFHDEVLSEGSVPLPVLDARVDDWIRSRRAPGGDGR